MGRSRLVACVLGLLLAACGAFPNSIPQSMRNRNPNGAYAYAEWLRALGYKVVSIEGTPGTNDFKVPEGVDAVVMLRTASDLSKEDAETLYNFVDGGGTLLVHATRRIETLEDWFDYLDVRTLTPRYTGTLSVVPHALPGFGGLLDITSMCEVDTYLEIDEDAEPEDALPLLTSSSGETLMLMMQQYAGRVVAFTPPCIFTNAGLEDETAARLTRSLLADVPPGGTIAFDEYHLNFRSALAGNGRSTRPSSSQRFEVDLSWPALFNTPWGLALLLGTALCMFALALGGRRFGPPIPLTRDVHPRTGAEFVRAMAALYRRNGKRSVPLTHLKHRLKRGLGARHAVEPDLPDDEYLRVLLRARPELAREPLRALLADLADEDCDDATLITLARKVDAALT